MVRSRNAHASVRSTALIAMLACGALHRGRRHDADADIALDQTAHRIEAAQLHAQPQRPPDAAALSGEKALQGAGAVEPDKIVIEHFGESDLRVRLASG